ncbi:hypothetical protein ACFQ2B_22960 [Streptomyces stramineus]|uniref:Uncharacterized protein n=1 Tax=Streptomyces stramineus TaxID=173861 RepID=A0ABP3KU29_9ACTN
MQWSSYTTGERIKILLKIADALGVARMAANTGHMGFRSARRPPARRRLEHDGTRDLWSEREPLLFHWALSGRPAPSSTV